MTVLHIAGQVAVAALGGLTAGALTLHAIARYGLCGAARRSRPHDLL